MVEPKNFATLIGSRICHDLISPIGAINNGLELMEMSAVGAASPEMSLISDSVRNASARVRFFRIAFGHAGDQMVGPPEVRSLLKDVFSGGRLSVVWLPATPQMRRRVRLSLLALMCAESAMPYGGRVEIDADTYGVRLSGDADKMNVAIDLWDGMTGKAPLPDLAPAHVQFGLLAQLAADDGLTINVATGADRLEITVR